MDLHPKEINRPHLCMYALLGYGHIPTLDISGAANRQGKELFLKLQ